MEVLEIVKNIKRWQFGDYQTPRDLADESLKYLKGVIDIHPKSIVEPTCGVGNFLLSAADNFTTVDKLLGLDINNEYLTKLYTIVHSRSDSDKFILQNRDFFKVDWDVLLCSLPKPILLVGNPPWVTNSDLGKVGGFNLPTKSNFQKYDGIDAITGRSNFDISEYMLMRQLGWVTRYAICITVLCKISVARKILYNAWRSKIPIKCRIVHIDAMKHFRAAVDACLFIIQPMSCVDKQICNVFANFTDKASIQTIGLYNDILLSDASGFHENRDILGVDPNFVWRSGIKHDCSKVMELTINDGVLFNGFGDTVDIERDLLFPLLKGSDIGNGRTINTDKVVIVPQRRVGQDTNHIQRTYPKTWEYLVKHLKYFESRGSSIYRNKPPFSIFGVGDYTFSNWKVAISGFYKKLNFRIVGPIDHSPVVFDDTVYFLSLNTELDAESISALLNSTTSKAFLESMILWSNKRPITRDLLKRVHIGKLATKLGYSIHTSHENKLVAEIK